MRRLFALSLLLLSACGSVLTVTEDPPPKPGMGQIVFRRIGNATILPGNAKIEINGERIASLGAHERQVTDIKPGHTVVSVSDSLFSFGRYTIEFEAAAGKTYLFNIAVRGDMIVQALSPDYKITEATGTFKIGQGS